jgi:HAD superfamily hydrolase (TIGR01509 family)
MNRPEPRDAGGTPLLIFDCDGVLVDSETIANATLAELMTSLGHAMSTEDSIRIFGGRSLKDVLATAAELLGGEIPAETSARYGEQLFARFRTELEPVHGVRKAIEALPHRRCVASSSHPDRLRLSLEVTGLAPLFGDRVFSATQVARGKPAPDLFRFAAESMGHATADCIVIEDSPRGIEAARAAGMRVIGFAGASHATDVLAHQLHGAGADRVIRAMSDLPSSLDLLRGHG